MNLPIGPVKDGIKLSQDKECGCCGQIHAFAPKDSKIQIGLIWWDCECGSTLAWEEEGIAI